MARCGGIGTFPARATAVSAVFRLCTVRTAETAVAHRISLTSCNGPLTLLLFRQHAHAPPLNPQPPLREQSHHLRIYLTFLRKDARGERFHRIVAMYLHDALGSNRPVVVFVVHEMNRAAAH